MKSTILVGTIAALAVSGAFANEPQGATPGSSGVDFKSLDTNGDGRISQSEASASPELSSAYSTAASDPSKGMTQQEFDAWKSQQSGQTPPSQ